MNFENVLQNKEKTIFSLRSLYLSCGYTPYRMSKFEEYDLYAENKDFLVSDNVITFTDTDGKLMALKPDVTLSIIKNHRDEPEKIKKVFYDENVYRVSDGSGLFKEITQAGVECFGDVKREDISEVFSLAAKSLLSISPSSILAVSDLAVVCSLISSLPLDSEKRASLYNAVGLRNIQSIDATCEDIKDNENVLLLKKLLSTCGKLKNVLSDIKSLLSDKSKDFCLFLEMLAKTEYSDMIIVDFSLMSDINYYNGIVFKGYIKGVPSAVLSGGQYDNLMIKMGKKSKAVGFAVYIDMVERIGDAETQDADDYINVALPKGRLGEKVYSMFASSGFDCPSILENNRKLIFENPDKKTRFFWVKPSDVAIYVERGAADIGVAGKDILLEYEPDILELLDLKCGVCRMAVAAPNGFKDDASKTLRVATKFSNCAKKYYRSIGRNIDIIHLNGSIELAPILKLSDVIVDIVETGTTLKENGLSVVEEIFPISTRLIANVSSAKFKAESIGKILTSLTKLTEEQK